MDRNGHFNFNLRRIWVCNIMFIRITRWDILFSQQVEPIFCSYKYFKFRISYSLVNWKILGLESFIDLTLLLVRRRLTLSYLILLPVPRTPRIRDVQNINLCARERDPSYEHFHVASHISKQHFSYFIIWPHHQLTRRIKNVPSSYFFKALLTK